MGGRRKNRMGGVWEGVESGSGEISLKVLGKERVEFKWGLEKTIITKKRGENTVVLLDGEERKREQ